MRTSKTFYASFQCICAPLLAMHVYTDLERLLKEKNVSKNKVCEACKLQRTQLNNYCKNKVSRIDLTILARLCEFLDCTPNDILKLK